MKSSEVRRRYIEFFSARKHAAIPSVSLIPENDPSTLFTSSGMQPLVPYLLGEKHQLGTRLVNSQQSFRAQDIDEVGDNRHTTFFEMLGNWSLGDYFKADQIPWIFEFLVQEVGIPAARLYVTVFEGNSSVPRDTESAELWKKIYQAQGIEAREGERIFYYPARKNWWSRSGEPEHMPPGEPGGPDSEMFFEYTDVPHDARFGERCHPNCDCGRFVEIGNSVFMQYKKESDGSLSELSQRNVDFGGGLERIVAASENINDVFLIDSFKPLIDLLVEVSGKSYGVDEKLTRSMRIVADHTKAATMLMASGALPSNKLQGYVVRRLLRRAIRFSRVLGISEGFMERAGRLVLDIYEDTYPTSAEQRKTITDALSTEERKFGALVSKGLKEIEKIPVVTGEIAFRLFETYGFPWEMTEEIVRERGQEVRRADFEAEFKRHQEKSRSAAKGMFKGGMADHGEELVRLHTATHLAHQALRMILGNHVQQKGSNITAERMRFDFSHPQKVTDEELRKAESIVNEAIAKDLPVSFTVATYQEAVEGGALAFFGERYPEKVKVYTIGEFSKEICGGPHVSSTRELGKFVIFREEASSAGVRRIYGKLVKAATGGGNEVG